MTDLLDGLEEGGFLGHSRIYQNVGLLPVPYLAYFVLYFILYKPESLKLPALY